jgi:hypothetical protein
LLTYFLNDFEIVPVAPIITVVIIIINSICVLRTANRTALDNAKSAVITLIKCNLNNTLQL